MELLLSVSTDTSANPLPSRLARVELTEALAERIIALADAVEQLGIYKADEPNTTSVWLQTVFDKGNSGSGQPVDNVMLSVTANDCFWQGRINDQTTLTTASVPLTRISHCLTPTFSRLQAV